MKTDPKSIYKKALFFFIIVIIESILGCSDYFGIFFIQVFADFLLIPLAILFSMIFLEYFGLQDIIDGSSTQDEKTDMNSTDSYLLNQYDRHIDI